MCGVFACLRPPCAGPRQIDIDAVLASLGRRGPDGQDVFHFADCSLAHTRLAIFRDPGGQQPMVHPETGLALSYNGEIYNASSLRRRLQAKGHVFQTRTDTEVVLAAFASYGADCVSLFEGMFAFVIWDPRKNLLTLVRDRLGEKPLFHAQRPDGWIVVASEIKALLAAGVSPDLDAGALDHFLPWKHLPSTQSIYAGISVVPPAHLIEFSNGQSRVHRYWQLPGQGQAVLSKDDAIEETRRLLSTSVKNRLSGDRAVGLSLSGGVDSSLIAAFASQARGHCYSSYTVSYELGQDEVPRAQEAAAVLGLSHCAIPLSVPDPDALEAVASYLDQPHADSANLAQAMLCERASQEVAVLLTGDGADEIFWGYRWYSPQSTPAARAQ